MNYSDYLCFKILTNTEINSPFQIWFQREAYE